MVLCLARPGIPQRQTGPGPLASTTMELQSAAPVVILLLSMPFHYDLPLPELQEAKSAKLIRWLVSVGAPISKGTAIAVVECPNGNRYRVSAAGEGSLRTRLVAKGQAVRFGEMLAVINGDVENIPYDRPYSTASPLNACSSRKFRPD